MEITLSQAIDGFLLAKEVEGLSPYTIRNYTLTLHRALTDFFMVQSFLKKKERREE